MEITTARWVRVWRRRWAWRWRPATSGLFDPDAAPGKSPFDHYIYVVASDGDMEEWMSLARPPLAGTNVGQPDRDLGRQQDLDRHNTDIALSEDVPARYRAYGWHVQEVEGGENVVGIEDAIEAAKR